MERYRQLECTPTPQSADRFLECSTQCFSSSSKTEVTRFSGKKKPKPALHASEHLPLSLNMGSSAYTPLEETIVVLDSLAPQSAVLRDSGLFEIVASDSYILTSPDRCSQ
jgi:hypothetical protein